MDAPTDFALPLPGERITVPVVSYAFGPSPLSGPGTVLENRDFLSRERGDVVIRFDRGITGVFRAKRLEELLK